MSELAARRLASAIAVSGEVIDPRGLAARAAEVAARQRSPETRRTYAAVYAKAAGLPEDRRTPHVLRHTFCTHLADAPAPTSA